MGNSVENKQVELKKSFFSLRTLLGFAVGAVIIYIFFRNFDFNAARETMSGARWHFFIIAALCFYISIPLRGLRWRLQMQPIGIHINYRPLTHYYFLAMFANVILPARIGDIYRAYLTKRNQKISISMSLGVFFSERIFDLVVISIFVIFSGAYFWKEILGTKEGDYLIYGFMAIILLVAFFAAALGGLPHLLRFMPAKLAEKLNRFHQGLFRYPSRIPIILGMTALIWICEALRLYFVFLALGANAGFVLALFISQASLVIMSLPLSPAGLGFVELLMLKVLSLSGLSPELAGALTISDRLISYWSVMALGGLCYFFSTRIR
ncbi:MAG: flippase-like domain-containing protein [Candidatus Zixiibacteriota bacterium]|nr:MAG: flippase-like domain-containing protein [candidate division Zixibacteria bacterium]